MLTTQMTYWIKILREKMTGASTSARGFGALPEVQFRDYALEVGQPALGNEEVPQDVRPNLDEDSDGQEPERRFLEKWRASVTDDGEQVGLSFPWYDR